MHKVTLTQNSTGRQMDYMRDNLCEKYKAETSVQRLSIIFRNGGKKTAYWVSVKGVGYGFRNTWEEAQAYYKELMRLKPEKEKP